MDRRTNKGSVFFSCEMPWENDLAYIFFLRLQLFILRFEKSSVYFRTAYSLMKEMFSTRYSEKVSSNKIAKYFQNSA